MWPGLLVDILRRPIQLPIYHARVSNPRGIIRQPCTSNTLLGIDTQFHARGPVQRENGTGLRYCAAAAAIVEWGVIAHGIQLVVACL